MGWRVLETGRIFSLGGQNVSDPVLLAAGLEPVPSTLGGPLQEDQIIPLLQGCDAVIASNDRIGARAFSACPRLKVVSRCGVGYDTIDVPAATAAGVVVTSTPGVMTDAVADFTMGQILVLARGIVAADGIMREGRWGAVRGMVLAGKTLGLVGYGDIGKGVALRAAPFGLRILAYDPAYRDDPTPSPSPSQGEGRRAPLPLRRGGAGGGVPPVEFVDLDTLVSESDFISLHAPGSPETHRMFDAARIARMKPTAYLVNTARGSLIDEEALVAALEAGAIGGAAIDVYEREPLAADHPLRRAPRCLLTPHNAFCATEAMEAMGRRAAENVVAIYRGEQPEGTRNPEVWSSPALRVRAGAA